MNHDDTHIYYRANPRNRARNYAILILSLPCAFTFFIGLIINAIHLDPFSSLICALLTTLFAKSAHETIRLAEEARIDAGILTAKPYLGKEKEMPLTEIDSLTWRPKESLMVNRYVYAVSREKERIYFTEKDLNDDGKKLLKFTVRHARTHNVPEKNVIMNEQITN